MMILALVKKPGLMPEQRQINLNDEDAMVRIVGGHTETIEIVPERLVLICNSEGEFLELPKNVLLENREIRGNVVFAGLKDGSLSDIAPVDYQLLMNNVERYAI